MAPKPWTSTRHGYLQVHIQLHLDASSKTSNTNLWFFKILGLRNAFGVFEPEQTVQRVVFLSFHMLYFRRSKTLFEHFFDCAHQQCHFLWLILTMAITRSLNPRLLPFVEILALLTLLFERAERSGLGSLSGRCFLHGPSAYSFFCFGGILCLHHFKAGSFRYVIS